MWGHHGRMDVALNKVLSDYKNAAIEKLLSD